MQLSELLRTLILGTIGDPASAQELIDAIETGENAVSSLNSLQGDVNLVAGSNITITPSGNDLTIAAIGDGTGTVTSAAMTVPSFLSVSGSPITTSGTFAVTLTSQTANKVMASPDGSSGTPSFRALVAGDLPSLSYANQDLSNLNVTTAINSTLFQFGGATPVIAASDILGNPYNGITLRGGQRLSADGGPVTVQGGNASGVGGTATLKAGNSTGNVGGQVAINGGNSTISTAGSVTITPGTGVANGVIKLDDLSGTITSGQLWRSSSTDGSGLWSGTNLTYDATNKILYSGPAATVGSNSPLRGTGGFYSVNPSATPATYDSGFFSEAATTTNFGGNFIARRANGTPGSGTGIVTTNQTLGNFGGAGWDGVSYSLTAAGMRPTALSLWSASNHNAEAWLYATAPSTIAIKLAAAVSTDSSYGGGLSLVNYAQSGGMIQRWNGSTQYQMLWPTAQGNGFLLNTGSGTTPATWTLPTGDVSSTSGGVLTVTKLRGTTVSSTPPTDGQVLTYNLGATQWEAQTLSSVTTKYTKTFTDLSTAATTNSITLFSLPAATILDKVVIKPTASFTGGSISAYTISVGISGNNAKYASAYDVFQSPGGMVFQLTNSSNIEDFSGPMNIRITAISTGDTLNNASTGSVDVYVLTKTIL